MVVDGIAGMVEIHDELFLAGLAMQSGNATPPFPLAKVHVLQGLERGIPRYVLGNGGLPPLAECGLVDPIGREAEGEPAELAQEQIPEGVVGIPVQVEPGLAFEIGQFLFLTQGDDVQDVEKPADLTPPTALVGTPSRPGTRVFQVIWEHRRYVVIADDLPCSLKELQHVRQKLDVALLERPPPGRRKWLRPACRAEPRRGRFPGNTGRYNGRNTA